MPIRKEHAERNQSLCDNLFTTGPYYDWVATTAFYSALHYVQHRLFEVTPSLCPYTTLEAAKAHYGCHSLHKVRQHLITDHFAIVSVDYSFLEKTSRTARYLNYGTSKEKAAKARQRLENIKKHCCLVAPPAPKP